MTASNVDLQSYVERAAASGHLVVQPRMGMSDPAEMAAGLRAVAGAQARTIGTITLDSYTRVEDLRGAAAALAAGTPLNGFPIVSHGPATTAQVVAATGYRVPVQVRHGSARPARIFEAMTAAGLTASEGGPVSYCLPYSRLPLAESVPAWEDASARLAQDSTARGARAHLETFGGCLLGQMCPPSLLVALSVLEAMFFAQCGLTSVSLSYAQQTNAVQDIEALAALRRLAAENLPDTVAWHIVLYTYMGVYPRTDAGAGALLDNSAQIAVRGGAARLIVKTSAEAHRLPTVAENITALERASAAARHASTGACQLPWARQADYESIYTEASTLIQAVLAGSGHMGTALRRAFADGLLDVPFCLHQDNAGIARAAIDDDGRLAWTRTGAMPIPSRPRASTPTLTSAGLLGMLRYAADAHERRAALDRDTAPYRIAIVGSGPRGLAVAERLAARMSAQRPGGEVEITLIDKAGVGGGRIWHPGQDPSFLMNTPSEEVTMFSGPSDAGPARAGAGPSLGEWWPATDPGHSPGLNRFAPRAVYGDYLRFYLDSVESSLPGNATLRRVLGEVTALHRAEAGWRLSLAGGEVFRADRVVLATGHPGTELPPDQASLSAFAAAHRPARYIRGDSAADMPLEAIAPGDRVGVVGLGLTFYDVASAVTIGRGGRFDEDGRGGLRYLPSGREPTIVAGSRSGMLMPARGRNQKASGWRYIPRLFTPERIAALRHAGPLDFRADVWPWLNAEMQLVYYATAVRARHGTAAEHAYVEEVVPGILAAGAASAEHVARQHAGRPDLAPLDPGRLARPFAGRHFTSPAEFRQALRRLLEQDIAEARLGNHHGPLKAALDVLRDVRGVIRQSVDHGGLTAASHQRDFAGWFAPWNSLLASGPPLVRLRQAMALLDAGIVEVVGPSACFGTDDAEDAFTMSSPQVAGSAQTCGTLIDARIPVADVRRDRAPLTRQLVRSGTWTSWVNRSDGEPFDTGGVAVTRAPYRPVDRRGGAVDGLYVLGIPSEGPRWFMQMGSARPGPWTQFTQDADAIAADVLAHAPRPAAVPALTAAL